MLPRSRALLPCVPALLVSLSLSLPARAAEPAPGGDASAQLDLQMRAHKRVRNIGIGTLTLGAVMLGVGGGLEHKRRTDICAEKLSEDHGDACDRSKMANITVLAMGVASFIGGAVLVGIGQSRLNRARRTLADRGVSLGPQLGRGFAGAMLSARF